MRLPSSLWKPLTSEYAIVEYSTPTSGPGGVKSTPGGKCCWRMNPAVREVRASPPLLRKAAVPAFDTAMASCPAVKFWLPSAARTSSSRPSRSTIAITEPGEICCALPAAWA